MADGFELSFFDRQGFDHADSFGKIFEFDLDIFVEAIEAVDRDDEFRAHIGAQGQFIGFEFEVESGVRGHDGESVAVVGARLASGISESDEETPVVGGEKFDAGVFSRLAHGVIIVGVEDRKDRQAVGDWGLIGVEFAYDPGRFVQSVGDRRGTEVGETLAESGVDFEP